MPNLLQQPKRTCKTVIGPTLGLTERESLPTPDFQTYSRLNREPLPAPDFQTYYRLTREPLPAPDFQTYSRLNREPLPAPDSQTYSKFNRENLCSTRFSGKELKIFFRYTAVLYRSILPIYPTAVPYRWRLKRRPEGSNMDHDVYRRKKSLLHNNHK